MRGQVSGRGFGAQGQGHSVGKAPPRSASRALSDRKESAHHKGPIGRVTAALPALTRSPRCEGLQFALVRNTTQHWRDGMDISPEIAKERCL